MKDRFRMQDDTAELYIYDEIGEAGPFWDAVSAKDVIAFLMEVSNVPLINVHLNSPGGDVGDGAAIYNALHQNKAKVVVHIDGFALSAASVVAMAGDQIRMSENSLMMIHKAWARSIGNADDMRKTSDVLSKVDKVASAVYSARTDVSQERALEMMAEETWMTADEAKELGFADMIIEAKQKPDEAMQRWGTTQLLQQYRNLPGVLKAEHDRQLGLFGADVREMMLKAVPHKRYPLVSTAWDGGAARNRMRAWASRDGSGDIETVDWPKYQKGFTWYDAAHAQSVGSYKLPHHDISDGGLVTVRQGVIAAGNAVSGARGGVDIPASEMPAVKSHLEKHYREFGISAPWKGSQKATKTPMSVLSTERDGARIGNI